MTAPQTPTSRYHHGDLPSALLIAAGTILENEGIEALTLRACARMAGVSHAAPAHHFKDRKALLSACAARAFEALGERMASALAEHQEDPFEQLRASGLAYIGFAKEKPGAFQLIFRCDLLDTEHPPLKAAADACYLGLLDIVRKLLPLASEDSVHSHAILAWSTVHGFATLLLNGHFANVCPPGLETGREDWLAERITAAMRPVFQDTTPQ